jgi:hypothetical protein
MCMKWNWWVYRRMGGEGVGGVCVELRSTREDVRMAAELHIN